VEIFTATEIYISTQTGTLKIHNYT